uniref:Uncharacterized protein n=1 Tax=Parastrongyloides trichosuri TaxID=131310 RepID=A0A0N4ZJI5_PARTI
MDSVVKSVQV